MESQNKAYTKSVIQSFLVVVTVFYLAYFVGVFSKYGGVFYTNVSESTKYFQEYFGIVEKPLNKKIVIIGIDEKSIASIGKWPIPVSVFSEVLEKLSHQANRPASIGLDTIFSSSQLSENQFEQRIRDTNAYVIIDSKKSDPAKLNVSEELDSEVKLNSGQFASFGVHRDSTDKIKLFNDGIPSLALAMSNEQSSYPKESEYLFTREMLSDEYLTFTISDVLSPNFDGSIFKDALVIVGNTGKSGSFIERGLHQINTLSGAYTTASLLEQIANKKLIAVASVKVALLYYTLIIICVFAGILALNQAQDFWLTTILWLGNVFISVLLLIKFHYWLNPIPAFVMIVFTKMGWSWKQMQMIVGFMQSRAEALKSLENQDSIKSRSFAKHTVLQCYSSVDGAITSAQTYLNNIKALANTVPEPLVAIDQNKNIVFTNEKFRYLADLSLSKTKHFPEVLEKLGTSWGKVRAISSSAKATEHLTLKHESDGEKKFYINQVDLVWNTDDNLSLLLFIDVTALMIAQSQRERTLQFLSHDMRVPVSGILTLSRNSSENGVSSFADITKHARRALSMMDDFLLSIKADSEKYQFKREFFDSLVEQSLYEVSVAARSRSIEFRVNQHDLCYVMCDARLLERVLVNLIGNAIRYGETGSIVHIHVSKELDQANQPMLVCEIVNSIALLAECGPSDLGNKGFSLGLPFVRHVVERHGGSLEHDFNRGDSNLAVVRLKIPYTD